MTYVKPGMTVVTGSAANVGGNVQQGLTAALIGSFPKGPCWPVGTLPGTAYPAPFPSPQPASVIAGSLMQLMATWGDDQAGQNDLAGWTGPGYARLLHENNAGLTPQVMVIRTGTSQASVTLSNGASGVVWTATALFALGGSTGNGLTVQYTSPSLVVTVPAGSAAAAAGFQSETWAVGASATWATIAGIVNGQSKLIWLNSASSDTAATAAATLGTLAGGADGANPTLAQINAGTDSLGNLTYDQQPIHLICPAFADTGSGGALKHALGDAIANEANGQRMRVIGGIAPAVGGTGNLTTILAMATDLQPAENGGDSGRCVLWANNLPYRIDPATGVERLYPGWAPAAAHAGLEASVPVQRSLGRGQLSGFTRFAEGYTQAERSGASGLYASGVMVCGPDGRMRDQVTTAIATSYRRDDNIARAEDWWVADLEGYLNDAAIEIAAGPSAGITINDLAEGRMDSYVQAGVIAGYALTTRQSSSDARNWQVGVSYTPIFVVRTINPLSVQLVTPAVLTVPTITVSTAA